MEDILILAGSDQELIDRYLDKEKNATDYAQLKELEEKHGRDYGLTDIVYAQLKRKLFQRALKNFVLRVCQEQRDLCEQGFWEAECGDGGMIWTMKPDLTSRLSLKGNLAPFVMMRIPLRHKIGYVTAGWHFLSKTSCAFTIALQKTNNVKTCHTEVKK